MAQIIKGSVIAKPLYTLPTSLSDVDSRNKIYINKGEEVSLKTFSVLVNPYPHLRVHVHIKPDKTGTEEIGVGVYEIDAVQFTRDELEEINGTKVTAYHQVYSTAQGTENGYKKDGNTPIDKDNYNEAYKNIIYYTSDTKKVYLNGESYGGGEAETYTPNASDDAVVDVQSVTAEELKGKTVNEVLDTLLFPEYNASAGTLPSIKISNGDTTLEVGETIPQATYTITAYGSAYKYIKKDNKYVQDTYKYTTPTVTTTITANKTNAIFGTLTRSTAQTTYTVTGPSEDQLSNGKLFKSKGASSTVYPLQVGTGSKTLNSTSATITGVYAGGKNGNKSSEIWVKSSGQLASTKDGSYSNTLSYDILSDTKNTKDHSFSTIGTNSVELYVPTGISYTVKLTATKYEAGSGAFIEDKDLTTQLNNLITNTSSKTFTDAGNSTYSVSSYSIDTSTITSGGKFQVKMNITKN